MRIGPRRTWLLSLGALVLIGLALLRLQGAARAPGGPKEPAAAADPVSAEGPPPALRPAPAPKRPKAEAAPDVEPAVLPPAPPSNPEPRLRIHGRVLSSSGVPLVGASVELRAWSGTPSRTVWSTRESKTAADGSFEFAIDRGLASQGFGLATIAESSLEAIRVVKFDEYDESRGVDLEVEAARAISGRVLDEGARPISGATVQLWYGSETTWPTPVDAAGRFLTPQHAPRGAFELVVEAPGFPRRTLPMAAADVDRTEVGDVVFRRGGTLSGVVLDTRGEPVQDLPLVVALGQSHSPRTRTDSAGRFEFTDLGLGTVSIWVDAPDDQGGPPGSRRSYRGGLNDLEVGRRDVRIVAETLCALVLRFLDAASGQPVDVRPVEYGARLEGTPAPGHVGQTATSSDPLLSVRLSVPSGHRYDVTVRSPGFEEARRDGIDVGDLVEMTIDVRMRRAR